MDASAYHLRTVPRASKKAAEVASARLEARFVRSELWNGFVRGDVVRIAGIRGGHWRFRHHVENTATGTSWVEVDELDVPRGAGAVARRVAGAGEHAALESDTRLPPVRRVRAFSEDRVSLARVRRRAAAPRDATPQLPQPAPVASHPEPSEPLAPQPGTTLVGSSFPGAPAIASEPVAAGAVQLALGDWRELPAPRPASPVRRAGGGRAR